MPVWCVVMMCHTSLRLVPRMIMGAAAAAFPAPIVAPPRPVPRRRRPPRRRYPRASGGSSNYFFFRWSDSPSRHTGVPCPLPRRYAPAPSPSARRRNPRGALSLRSCVAQLQHCPGVRRHAPARKGAFLWLSVVLAVVS